MSKKVYSTPRWKRRIRNSQHREEKKRKRKDRGSRHTHPGFQRRHLPPQLLKAPQVFSLIENPSETITFLRRLEFGAPLFRLTIDCSEVTRITPDAPLALIGTLERFGKRSVRGNLPKDPNAKAILEQSGFFDHVQHAISLEASGQGVMLKHTGSCVDPTIARELILRGTELLCGEARDSEASYGIFIEGMENTIAHARSAWDQSEVLFTGTEQWWASVCVDRDRSRICFVVLDLGVGILKSARIRAWRKVSYYLRRAPASLVLQELLAGKLPSRTGLANRGKGLPSLKALSNSGAIKDCRIVTNNVFARVGEETADVMDVSFGGTLLYWEI